ncbi:isoprenylcysteine carboxylmethyltransferase family protein [Herbiconiux sp. CPCC 205763]|uniref:Isoprenylcysteine carboxylmethyltransferase family protein n=1 Tax=Herbiconiux aconitum TaxID=2970913 RepID=A0ABT2GXU1_9MICO|nr:isoprenylcysteine carboxylmethyltransferase family protein [Herbiconiux aconitum]MCS5719761.1 isoprenylcysteine carboxylmethyltransferase family protein [Herbiconiux aconitum]
MTRLRRWARAYFALQAVAGGAWWVAVFTWPAVREATLGDLDPVAVAVFDIPLFVVASALAAMGFKAAAVVAAGWTTLVATALAVYATITTEAGWGVVVMAAAAAGSLLAVCVVVLDRIPTDWVIRGPFAFRTADARRTVAANVTGTFAQIVVFWGLFLVVIPLVIATLERRWAVGLAVSGFAGVVGVVGVVALVLASGLGIWSAIVMSTLGDGTPLPSSTANRLVIAGPYRWVRNPMALAGIAQGVAVGLILSSWLVIVYAVAGSLVWNYVVRPQEEADLELRFGDQFLRYRRAVRCWVPRRPRSAP